MEWFNQSPDIIIKTLLTIVLTGFLGAQRQKYEKPAGFKTHIFVGVGAMLTVMVGYFLYDKGYSLDITRMPAQVISGIGFLGAGTIFKSEDKISGLTTASTVWVSGSIGVAVGAGYYLGALLTTLVLFLLLELKDIKRYFFKMRQVRSKTTYDLAYKTLTYQEVVTLFDERHLVMKACNHLIDESFYVLTSHGRVLLDKDIGKDLGIRGGILLNCLKDTTYDYFSGSQVGYFKKPLSLVYFSQEEDVIKFLDKMTYKLKTGVAII